MASKPDDTTASAAQRKPTAQAKAVSLHIGLNGVSGAAYGGWDGPLAACEFDAHDMAAIAKTRGMKSTVLLTKQATRAKVLAGIRAAAKALNGGDLFFLSYSGHGGQVPDVNGDEPDRKDETWCLYDGQLLDDELYFELSRFAAGVRVLVLSDSCHSGSVTRELAPPRPPPGQRVKLMPDAVALRVYDLHKAFYDKLQDDVAKAAAEGLRRSRRGIGPGRRGGAGHPDRRPVQAGRGADLGLPGQPDLDGRRPQRRLHRATAQGLEQRHVRGNYRALHARIRARMPASQSPNLFTLGAGGRFLTQQPFTV